MFAPRGTFDPAGSMFYPQGSAPCWASLLIETTDGNLLLVPGAWLGGWCWRDVAAHLEADGHKPVGATLTSLGERAHLLSQHIRLHTHISDIVGWRNGHHRRTGAGRGLGKTYAAAEQIPAHIRYLVYLDASVPRDGESNYDVVGPEVALRLRDSANLAGEGWKVPMQKSENAARLGLNP
jgi:hypothetical protein